MSRKVIGISKMILAVFMVVAIAVSMISCGEVDLDKDGQSILVSEKWKQLGAENAFIFKDDGTGKSIISNSEIDINKWTYNNKTVSWATNDAFSEGEEKYLLSTDASSGIITLTNVNDRTKIFVRESNYNEATVKITVPKPEKIKIPFVMGMDYDEAQDKIVQSGLRVYIKRDNNDEYDKDTVFDVDPPEGTEIEKNEMVELSVSDGPVEHYLEDGHLHWEYLTNLGKDSMKWTAVLCGDEVTIRFSDVKMSVDCTLINILASPNESFSYGYSQVDYPENKKFKAGKGTDYDATVDISDSEWDDEPREIYLKVFYEVNSTGQRTFLMYKFTDLLWE